MKKNIGLLMVLIMLISVTVGSAGGTGATDTQSENVKEYKKTLNIVAPDPVIKTCLDHDVLSISGYNFIIKPSVPMLPVKTVSLVIPQSAKIKSIKVLSSTKEKMCGDYNILPVQELVPISRNTPVAFTPKNPSIYASSNPYPGKLIEYAGEGNLRDYRILNINVYPLQYNPAGKKVTYYNNIEIEVTYTAPPAKTEKTEDDEFSNMVKAMVSNPEDVDTLYITTTESTSSEILENKNVDYVIITSDALTNEFQTLVDHKIDRGLSAEVVNLSWITTEYIGNDTQEQIRNFIKDAKVTWGTKWVLLGGDTSVIPNRFAYSNFQSQNEFIPTDLYFSDLDGTWDANGNGIYGEVADNIDFYPDVIVGRAPSDTTGEVNTFVSKTIAYEQAPSDYVTSALFMAEYLDTLTDGGIAKDIIEDESIPDHYSVTKLYESIGNLNRTNAMTELNKGYGIINHVGHGNVGVIGTGPDALYNFNMDSLVNSPNNSIFYSLSCLSNAFEQDSFSEHFVLSQDGGGIAYIGNSRYGWYSQGSPNGPSDLYDREFFKSLFNEGFDHVGETLADSKMPFISNSQSGDTVYRWIQYSLNLLGDPETKIWTNSIPQPPELSVVADAQARVDVNGNFTVTATVSNLGDETATDVQATVSWIPESGLSAVNSLTQSIGNLTGGNSTTVYWTMDADTTGIYNMMVTAVDSTGNYSNSDTTTTEVTDPLETVTVLPNSASDNIGNDVTTRVTTSDDIYATLSVRKATDYVEMNFLADIPDGSRIYSVIFSYEHHETVDNDVYVEVWNGSAWVRHDGTIRGSDTTDSVDITAEIDTEAEAENSDIRYVCYNAVGRPEYCYLDCAQLSITYTLGAPKPPELSVIVTSPSTVNVNDSFIVDATVSNLGDDTATGVEATVTLPEGLSTTELLSKAAGDIPGGDSVTVSWNVTADSKGTYTITVNASATNVASANGTTIVDVVTPDTEPPVITYITGDTSTTTGDSVDIVVNATDDVGPTSAKIFIDGNMEGSGMTEGPDDTFTHIYTAPADSVASHAYYVMVYDDADNSVTSITHTIIVTDNDAPTADAGPDQTVVVGNEVTFNGSSSSDNIDILSYSWDFNATDGITEDATGETSTYTYSTLGTYTVTLTVTDGAGNNNSDTLIVTVIEEADTIHIASINMSNDTKSAGPNVFTWALATVTVVNSSGSPVSGAQVTGIWSNLTSDSDTATTGTEGKVTVLSDSVKWASGTYTFTVTDLTYDGLAWDGENSIGSITV